MRLDTDADIAAGLDALARLDPRLRAVIAASHPVVLRRRAPGFEGLAATIVAQQISSKAAAAIWSRFAALGPVRPDAVLVHAPEALRAAGLSANKVRTLTAMATAIAEGRLDLDALGDMDPEAAIAALVPFPGIGRWTAEIYLLFCLGHRDIFPAGDLALQIAAADALGLPERPSDKALRAIAEAWSPWRGVAAKLLWRYYHVTRDRPGTLSA